METFSDLLRDSSPQELLVIFLSLILILAGILLLIALGERKVSIRF